MRIINQLKQFIKKYKVGFIVAVLLAIYVVTSSVNSCQLSGADFVCDDSFNGFLFKPIAGLVVWNMFVVAIPSMLLISTFGGFGIGLSVTLLLSLLVLQIGLIGCLAHQYLLKFMRKKRARR